MVRKTVFLIIVILACLPGVWAVSIGISPGRVNFQDLLRDGYAEKTIRVTTNSPDELTAKYTVSGDIAKWIRFEPNASSFSMSSSQPYLLKIIINPPADTRSDTYSGKIDFVTDHFGSPGGRAGGFVKAAVSLMLNAEVTDEQVIRCRAGSMQFRDIEEGFPLEITYTVINDGNVRIAPLVRYDIWDSQKDRIVLDGSLPTPEVLPTVEQRFETTLDTQKLDIGQYWANIYVDQCGASNYVSFSVVEKGGIVDKGELVEIRNKVWSYEGEPLEISAIFQNNGPRIVSARFEGTISLDNNIIAPIETDELDVLSGERISLSTFFTPPQAGRYVVSGKVIYNRKSTFEKGSIINVTPKEEESSRPSYMLLFIYLIIIISIIFMLRKIIKGRKKRPF